LPRRRFMNMPQIMKMTHGKPPTRPSWAMGPAFHGQRLEHITLIGECLILWPAVEGQMASLLAAIMRAHNDSAIAVYLGSGLITSSRRSP
jgi:hypothetical protein